MWLGAFGRFVAQKAPRQSCERFDAVRLVARRVGVVIDDAELDGGEACRCGIAEVCALDRNVPALERGELVAGCVSREIHEDVDTVVPELESQSVA